MKSISTRTILDFLDSYQDFEAFEVFGPSSLQNIKSFSLVFVNDLLKVPPLEGKYEHVLFLAKEPFLTRATCQVLLVDNPRLRFAQIVNKFFYSPEFTGVASTALCSIHSIISSSASIGEYSVIEDGVIIGDEVKIGHHTVICRDVKIGDRSQIGSNSVIGTTGLGFERDENLNPIRIPHLGGVVIGNDVEVGSCVTIARGTIDNTCIDNMVKIDDHVFIAHNVLIGARSILVAGCEVSGSVQIGEDCWIGPLSTIRDGVIVGRKSIVGMGAVVTKNVGDNKTVAGNPARQFQNKITGS
jgi:UDP-3-O-[3-hydroxymyristoyl] glucosamine N-acyltransferase